MEIGKIIGIIFARAWWTDVTGSGKTSAPILSFHRFLASWHASLSNSTETAHINAMHLTKLPTGYSEVDAIASSLSSPISTYIYTFITWLIIYNNHFWDRRQLDESVQDYPLED